jgi:ParB-like chromosome segregation protein Spo0J
MTIKLHTQLQTRPITDLIPYARNSRTHSNAQLDQIAASIQEYGFTNPVLIDETGNIIAGHGRVLAAAILNIQEIPCLTLTDLTPAQKRAYVIADNQIALNAGWDEDILQAEIAALTEEGYETDLLGFDLEKELQEITAELIQKAETQTDQKSTGEAAFTAEMQDKTQTGIIPIVPRYAEHQQAFILVCDNEIDEAWIRNKLKLDQPKQSYKDQKIQRANIINIQQLRAILE